MRTKLLVDFIKKESYNLDFELDGVGMTWGVSYIRFVIGNKMKFESLEHFFYSTLRSEGNMTSVVQGGETWEKRTDLRRWAIGLKVEPVLSENLVDLIRDSVREIADNLKHWTTENTVDVSQLILPDNFDSCWIIKETLYPRHYINTTETYLAVTNEKYYCIEGHWES